MHTSQHKGTMRVKAITRAFIAVAIGFLAYGICIGVLFSQINSQRYHNALTLCLETNERHDETIRQLDDLIRRLPPAGRTRAVQGRAGTVLLIDRLAPKHKDCAQFARHRIGDD